MKLKPFKGQLLSVLIVEDEEDLRDILIVLLQDLEIFNFVVGAVDGKDAMVKLSNQKFDLVLTDLNLPKVSGIDLAKQIKRTSSLSGTNIMLMSGALTVEDVNECKEIGLNAVIAKPFNLDKFKTLLVKNKIARKIS
jgi:CheY-like chemotaxis protein